VAAARRNAVGGADLTGEVAQRADGERPMPEGVAQNGPRTETFEMFKRIRRRGLQRRAGGLGLTGGLWGCSRTPDFAAEQ
jgi:hypothetical protein